SRRVAPPFYLGHRNLQSPAQQTALAPDSAREVLTRLRLKILSSPGWEVKMDLKAMADKGNSVPGWVGAFALDLAVWYYKTSSVFDVRASEWFVVAFVSDDGDVLIVLHLIAVGPISIG